mmetsp:Transcript_42056/g.50986  ORF Transcript_42056/g.50986 Transcript_42056/m.50986 type:complete len:103 (+) Transcript_42056:391-699(+)
MQCPVSLHHFVQRHFSYRHPIAFASGDTIQSMRRETNVQGTVQIYTSIYPKSPRIHTLFQVSNRKVDILCILQIQATGILNSNHPKSQLLDQLNIIEAESHK